ALVPGQLRVTGQVLLDPHGLPGLQAHRQLGVDERHQQREAQPPIGRQVVVEHGPGPLPPGVLEALDGGLHGLTSGSRPGAAPPRWLLTAVALGIVTTRPCPRPPQGRQLSVYVNRPPSSTPTWACPTGLPSARRARNSRASSGSSVPVRMWSTLRAPLS